ncbi:MAG: hypothetical protein LC745_07330 [Planctomycetia bacterium]|nr:hypothetical protein [Planctomycetia bacterium]
MAQAPHRWLAASLVLFLRFPPMATAAPGGKPIAPHPENPRYFLFEGKPTFLITSGEHYGAVLNLDFDFVPYLDELHRRGFNLTRTFAGTYREVPGSFKIVGNTLAPAPGRYAAPWARSATTGAADGGNKFDLGSWDEAYFQRLKTFCTAAAERGIVVELVLLCPFYDEGLWTANPMHGRNNVNDVGSMPRNEVFTLKHPEMVTRHEAFVRKVVGELKEFDNLYYEICNEPYERRTSPDWEARIARTIAEAERGLPARHMIAQNIANGSARIDEPLPEVSLFNFHYASPPRVVAENARLNRAIGDDETGFRGTADLPYRTEGWAFLLAGGSVYSNLDYSFTPDHEDGTARVVAPTPGGGGPALRSQLAILKRFLSGFDFLKMVPDRSVIASGVPAGASAYALAEPGRAYAIYVSGGSRVELGLNLPAGKYRVEWVDTRTGEVARALDLDHGGGRALVGSPEYSEDIALRIVARP